MDPHGHAGGATSITEHWNNRRGCQYLCRLGLLFQDIFWQHLVSVVVRQPVRLAITRFALASSGQGMARQWVKYSAVWHSATTRGKLWSRQKPTKEMQEVAGKHLQNRAHLTSTLDLFVGIDTIYIGKNESNKRNKEGDEPSQTEMTHDVRPVTWLNSPCSSEGHGRAAQETLQALSHRNPRQTKFEKGNKTEQIW